MDYTVILSQISDNQVQLLSTLSIIENILQGITLLFGIYFIYIFVRNLIKG